MGHMRLVRAVTRCAAFIALIAVAHTARATEGDSPASPVVARVNGTPITSADLDREAERILRREVTASSTGREQEARRRALDIVIDQELLWQESQREGITVREQDVIRELAVLRKSVASPDALEKALREMEVSPDTVRHEVERRLTVMALLERRLGNGAQISEEEVRRYYDRHPAQFRLPEKIRISHIVTRIDPRWQREKKAEARVLINQIRQRLRNGEQFAVLAREYSDCPSAEKGGDLGWFARGSLTPQLELVAFSLPAMVVSDVVEDRYGFHLVMITGRKAARTVPFAEARPKVVDYLKREKIRQEGLALARELRLRAKVQVMPEK